MVSEHSEGNSLECIFYCGGAGERAGRSLIWLSALCCGLSAHSFWASALSVLINAQC